MPPWLVNSPRPIYLTNQPLQRTRSRSPERRHRYSDRSRSPDRDRDRYRRDRSPANGHHDSYDRRGSAPSQQERVVAKEQMMSNIRESSQQDRRVYVGNLSYDVKWHHLKDFMRTGKYSPYHLYST